MERSIEKFIIHLERQWWSKLKQREWVQNGWLNNEASCTRWFMDIGGFGEGNVQDASRVNNLVDTINT